MPTSPTKHTWMTRLAHRTERPQGAVRAGSASSSDARVLDAHFAPCVLDLLGQARPQAHSARKADI